jgi:hypothetical protein
VQEFSNKPHNTIDPRRNNGRCNKKQNGNKCNEKAYGLFNGTAMCRRHYEDKLRLEKKYLTS